MRARAGVCRVWRHLHRPIALLAVGGGTCATRSLGYSGRMYHFDWCGDHCLWAAKLVGEMMTDKETRMLKIKGCERTACGAALTVAAGAVACGVLRVAVCTSGCRSHERRRYRCVVGRLSVLSHGVGRHHCGCCVGLDYSAEYQDESQTCAIDALQSRLKSRGGSNRSQHRNFVD